MRLRGILNNPIRAALLIICTILLVSPAVRAGESPLRALLTQAAIAKFGGDSVRVTANLLGTEAFDAAAEVMPDLVGRLDRPIDTATGGADFADGIVRRLGLDDMPGRLAKWHLRSGTVLKPSDLDRILTGYSKRTDILVAELPESPTCCDTAAVIEDIRAGGPSGHSLTVVGGAVTGAAVRHLAPTFIAEVVSLIDELAGILPEEVGGGHPHQLSRG